MVPLNKIFDMVPLNEIETSGERFYRTRKSPRFDVMRKKEATAEKTNQQNEKYFAPHPMCCWLWRVAHIQEKFQNLCLYRIINCPGFYVIEKQRSNCTGNQSAKWEIWPQAPFAPNSICWLDILPKKKTSRFLSMDLEIWKSPMLHVDVHELYYPLLEIEI